MRWRSAILACAIGLTANGAALAQQGLYVSTQGGLARPPKLEGTTGNTLFTNDFTTEVERGYVFAGAAASKARSATAATASPISVCRRPRSRR